MVGIVITGHNGIAGGMQEALRLLAGEYPWLCAVDFMAGEGEEELKRKLMKAKEEMRECSQFLILCDIMGGSPFKNAFTLFYRDPAVKLFYGVNLPMAVELVFRALENQAKWDLEAISEEVLDLLKKQQGSVLWPERE